MREGAIWMESGGFAGSSLLFSSAATKHDEECCRESVCECVYVCLHQQPGQRGKSDTQRPVSDLAHQKPPAPIYCM